MPSADIARMDLDESIERLDAMPEFLDTVLDTVDEAQMAFQPAPGEFSLREHACHLRDLEREGYLVRVRRTLAEPSPALESFDGAAVAAARNYLAQDARAAARDFAAARRELLELLAPLTDGQWNREARFAGAPVRLRDLVAMVVEHDREHRHEIERLVDALEAR
jgi:hypothetical protein